MEIRAKCPECGYEGMMHEGQISYDKPERSERPPASKRGPKPKPLKLKMKQLIELHKRYVDGETYATLGKEVELSAGQMQREFNKAGLTSEKTTHMHWKAVMAKRKASA